MTSALTHRPYPSIEASSAHQESVPVSPRIRLACFRLARVRWAYTVAAAILLALVSIAPPALAGGGCSSTSYFALLRASNTGGLELSSGGFQAGSQLFEGPEALNITGFSFYAYVEAGEEVDVTASLYLPDSDGFPDGAPLASDTVTVTSTLGSLESMEQQASFAGSVQIDQDYLLVIENDSTTALQLIANDPTAGDGEGEGLSSLLSGGFWQNGLDVMVGGTTFDADLLLQPDYVVVDFFARPQSPSPCLDGPGVLELTVDASPVFTSRFYNADIDNAFLWEFGDGSVGVGASVQHAYDGVGPWTVRLSSGLQSGQGGGCEDNSRRSFGSIPAVEAINVVERFNIFQVSFFPLSEGAEGWSWDFGDGDTSTAEAPVHVYPGLGFYTACVTSFNQCGEIPELCIDVLSPFPDISVFVQTKVTELDPGSPFSYEVQVWNFSGAASGAQTLSLQIPDALADVSWTCEVSFNGSGSCTSAGTASIDDSIQIDPQTILTYTVSGTYEPTSSEPLFLSGEVTVPGGDETDDNSDFAFVFATGTLFADGFETGDISRWDESP